MKKVRKHCEQFRSRPSDSFPAEVLESRFTFDEYEDDGKILRRQIIKQVDVREERKKFRAQDYDLCNLFAVGAVGMLQEVSPLPTQQLDAALDAMQRFASLDIAPSEPSSSPSSELKPQEKSSEPVSTLEA